MRKSATIEVGVSSDGVFHAGSSSEWQTVGTRTFSWMNTKGQKEASYRTNFIVTPRFNYSTGSRSIITTAKVKLEGDKKTYRISAGV